MKKEQLVNSFRNPSQGAESRRGIKGVSALLAGATLLFAFAADIQKATAHDAAAPPSQEELATLANFQDFESLLKTEDGARDAGIHIIAREGLLGSLSPDMQAVLLKSPQYLGLKDSEGNSVLAKHLMSKKAQFGSVALKKAIYDYTSSLTAEDQMLYFRLAAENRVYLVPHDIQNSTLHPLVGISKLTPDHLVSSQNVSIPKGPKGDEFHEVKANPVVDAIRNFQYGGELRAKVEALSSEQKTVLASFADDMGGTIGHYIAQSSPDQVSIWRDAINWTAKNNVGKTPLEIVASRKGLFTQLFAKEAPDVVSALLRHEDSRGALSALLHSHEILKQPDSVVRAVVTPDTLARTVSTLEPHCLVEYFSSRVMGGWKAGDVKTVWAQVNPTYKHRPEVQNAFTGVLLVLAAARKEAPTGNALGLALN